LIVLVRLMVIKHLNTSFVLVLEKLPITPLTAINEIQCTCKKIQNSYSKWGSASVSDLYLKGIGGNSWSIIEDVSCRNHCIVWKLYNNRIGVIYKSIIHEETYGIINILTLNMNSEFFYRWFILFRKVIYIQYLCTVEAYRQYMYEA
jgi:hypothetical protein